MAAESLLAERQARRDLSHTMPADRHRGNNQAYHIVHKLIVGWTTWKMRMGFMGKPLVADVVVFFGQIFYFSFWRQRYNLLEIMLL